MSKFVTRTDLAEYVQESVIREVIRNVVLAVTDNESILVSVRIILSEGSPGVAMFWPDQKYVKVIFKTSEQCAEYTRAGGEAKFIFAKRWLLS